MRMSCRTSGSADRTRRAARRHRAGPHGRTRLELTDRFRRPSAWNADIDSGMAGEILVGTSGWNYPSGRGRWNGVFYPTRRPRGFDELRFYAEHFDTVEVNSTFYRMPDPAAATHCLDRTP